MAHASSDLQFTRLTIPRHDGEIAAVRFANPGAKPLLFAHATGFCASAYLQMLAPLAGDFDVFAIDLRGHGRSTVAAVPGSQKSWNAIAADIGVTLDALRARFAIGGKWVLAGHSMGATAAAMAARKRGDIAGLALIEPVAMPPIVRFVANTPVWPAFSTRFPLVRGALSRRRAWPSESTALERYRQKALFKAWAPGVLENYLLDGLTEVTAAGGVVEWRLSCDPEWEASNFAAHGNDFWGAIKSAPAPAAVLAAEHGSTALMAGGAARFRRFGVKIEILSGAGHLAPMEDPAAAARFIGDFARAT